MLFSSGKMLVSLEKFSLFGHSLKFTGKSAIIVMTKAPRMIVRYYTAVDKFVKGLPVIRNIPGFNSLPEKITAANLRFYKVCNLVHTLGMFVHFSWLFFFLFLEVYPMVYINILSVAIYIFNIIINRKGFHFTSSVIMVIEIIAHQFIAVKFFGWNAGFQYFIVVIIIFPFIMHQGKWVFKSMVLATSVGAFLLMDHLYKNAVPLYSMPAGFLAYFRISNIAFSFVTLSIGGAYFNNAMHETEEKLARKTEELVDAEKRATLGEIATEMAHEIQNPLNFVNNFSELNEELLDELKVELNNTGNEEQIRTLVTDILVNNERIKTNGKRVSAIVHTLQERANAL
jgi:signal transduction histidine kinase